MARVARLVISNLNGRWFLTPLYDDASTGEPHAFDDMASATAYAKAEYPGLHVSTGKSKKRTRYQKPPRVWLHVPPE